jgi:hypothetical protein
MKKNMKKHIKSSIIATLLGTLFLGSCTNIDDRFENENKDQNNPTTASISVLLTNSENTVFINQGGYGLNTTNDGDGYLGQFSQHFAGSFSKGIEFDQYLLDHGSFSVLFLDPYYKALKDLDIIIRNKDPRNGQSIGVAKILTAYELGYLTSLYGDIPYSEAFKPEVTLFPKYDSQESIYTAIQLLLSEAITDINNGTLPIKGDYLYDGDSVKWKAAAYSLSARFYNHYSKKDPLGSATKALAAIDKAKALGMDSPKWDLGIKYEGTPSFQNPWVASYNNGQIIANKPFLDQLITTNDPRTESLFCSIDRDGEEVYGQGKIQSGIPTTTPMSTVGGDDSFYGSAKSTIPAASYAELLMIEAEAALRSGNPNRAAIAHNAGITTHVNQVTTLAVGLAKKAAFLNTYANETAATITLQKIMTQKHIIMIAMNVESWMDFRRTGNKFPTWSSIPLNSDETAPLGTKYIQRLLYPQSELNNNSKNVPTSTIYDVLPILK